MLKGFHGLEPSFFSPIPPFVGFWLFPVFLSVVITCFTYLHGHTWPGLEVDLHSHRSCTPEILLDVAKSTSKAVEPIYIATSSAQEKLFPYTLANILILSVSKFCQPKCVFQS